jgi:5-methylcytosine-specific restriction endonuclease McrA
MPERDYKKEYRDYHSKERQKKNRAKRNKASRNSNCKPGQEVDHKVPLIRGGSNAPSNWRVVSMETNRSKGSKTAQATDRLRSAIKYSSIKTAGLSGYNTAALENIMTQLKR